MSTVCVAVIDSGFPRIDSLDALAPLWVDFAGGVSEPPVLSGPVAADEGSHGSRAAATVAALASSDIRFLLCRVAASGAATDIDRDVANAIRFAVSHGAHIVYFGWVSYEPMPQVEAAIEAAGSAALFVAPAGNNTGDIDQNPVFPAAFTQHNLLVVTSERLLAVGPRHGDVGHGQQSVDAVVQGMQKIGMRLGTGLELGDTSGSAAAAAGLAARILSDLPNCRPLEIKRLLLDRVVPPESGDQATSLRSFTVSGGLLQLPG